MTGYWDLSEEGKKEECMDLLWDALNYIPRGRAGVELGGWIQRFAFNST